MAASASLEVNELERERDRYISSTYIYVVCRYADTHSLYLSCSCYMLCSVAAVACYVYICSMSVRGHSRTLALTHTLSHGIRAWFICLLVLFTLTWHELHLVEAYNTGAFLERASDGASFLSFVTLLLPLPACNYCCITDRGIEGAIEEGAGGWEESI